MSEVKDGYNFKLFSNSVNQTMRHDIYAHHRLLTESPQHQPHTYQPHLKLTDHDIHPRSLPANNWTQNTSEKPACATSTSPIPFLNSQQFKTPAVPALSSTASNQANPANNNSSIVIGSYHSVSDISLLSDNENDIENDSIFSNSLNATTCSSMQNNSGNQSNSSSSNANYTYISKPALNKPVKAAVPLVSQSDDFEFLRPKDPPLPAKSNNLLTASTSRLEQKSPKYSQSAYSTGNSLSCSSNGGSMSSLSPSPTPSLSNLNNQQNIGTTTTTTGGKSILFGIPRNCAPMPTQSADSSRHSIDSPFVDVTMNNCEDMSLYQPMKNLQISRAVLTPLIEPGQQQQNVAHKTGVAMPKPVISNATPTNNLGSASGYSLAAKNNFPLQQQHQQSFNNNNNIIINNSNNSTGKILAANSSANNSLKLTGYSNETVDKNHMVKKFF